MAMEIGYRSLPAAAVVPVGNAGCHGDSGWCSRTGLNSRPSIYQKGGAALRKTVEQRLEPHHVFLIFVSARCFGASGYRDKSLIGVTPAILAEHAGFINEPVLRS
jgi:hypothetical protein